MDCLNIEKIIKIENKEKWEKLKENYQNHCTTCDYMLKQYGNYVEDKIKKLENFHKNFWKDKPKDINNPIEKKTLIDLSLEHTPFVFNKSLEYVSNDNAWEYCMDIIKKVVDKQNEISNSEDFESILWDILWSDIVMKPKEIKEVKSDLPLNWKDDIIEIFEDKNIINLDVKKNKEPIKISYVPYEIKRIAASTESFKNKLMNKLDALKIEPIWQIPDNLENISGGIKYLQGKFYFELYSKIKEKIRFKFKTKGNQVEKISEDNYLNIFLGENIENNAYVNIWVGDKLELEEWLYFTMEDS